MSVCLSCSWMASLDTLATDYRTITEACGMLDRSERGKLALTGADARSFLQGQVTNDVEGLSAGQGCYAAFLTPKGKMLGDLRILDAGEEAVARHRASCSPGAVQHDPAASASATTSSSTSGRSSAVCCR